MLELRNIKKIYKSPGGDVEALKGIDLVFSNNEFVSILGPSGCGKTTLLNIIGGLDRYTSGDLLIEGKSTKEYKEKDWNTYRNHSIGFVFQSYNLIPHQTVVQNVEIALTIAGVSKKERRKRAMLALDKVGLSPQAKKKPNQLSGGQMQRVAIARAIVNEPEIILADEPTGALDSETSIQVMDILKELSRTTLVIMVTHNPDLASKYSTRIINLSDGLIIGDNKNEKVEEDKSKKEKPEAKKKHSSMNFLTALFLSLNNLISKKARTILVSFAGSIGIIGISLVLAISTGFQDYIDQVQLDTLSSYPLVVTQSSIDYSTLLNYRPDQIDKYPVVKEIYVNEMTRLISGLVTTNDITEEYVNNVIEKIDPKLISEIQYNYSLSMYCYTKKTEIVNGVETIRGVDAMNSGISTSMGGMSGSIWQQMLNENLMNEQYDVIAGYYPKQYNELLLVVNEYNQIMDMILSTLGLLDEASVNEDGLRTIDFNDVLGKEYKLLTNNEIYTPIGTNNSTIRYISNVSSKRVSESIYEKGEDLKIVGIARIRKDTTIGAMGQLNAIGYLPSLIDHIFEVNMESDIVNFQRNHPDINALTGAKFTDTTSRTTYEKLMKDLGGIKVPESINIYPVDFNAKEKIKAYLDDNNTLRANNVMNEAYYQMGLERAEYFDIKPDENLSSEELKAYYIDLGKKYATAEEKNQILQNAQSAKVQYTDIMAIIITSISTIIDAISYVLIAFTSISLVVSSIMIAVITYISVIERTKEIGILRAVGAKKKDVSSIFIAETFVIGLISGLFGIIVTILACIPINQIINNLAGIGNIAGLHFLQAFVIVLISVGLNIIAGLVPSMYASRLDPVNALRSE